MAQTSASEPEPKDVPESIPESIDEAPHTPDLKASETADAIQRSAVRPQVVHEAIRKEGEEELRRPVSALAYSGFAAGLSMGFSLVTQGLLRAGLPDTAWRPLISTLGYSVGFLIVILGRQQLFTENTVTAIIPLLARRNMAVFLRVLRLWAVVLTANLAGAALFAWVAGNTAAFRPEVQHQFTALGHEALTGGFGTIVVRGIFAGWLIALMVWLLPVADVARVSVIIIVTYVVGLGGLAHIVAGAVEVLYLVMTGAASWADFFGRFMVPTLLGNIIGGVSLVAALNHAQVISGQAETA